MNVTGIVFSNIYDAAMGTLTKSRTVASLPFGGRYRQIDFVLSDLTNSGIRKVGIITKYNYQSLMDHIAGASEWDFSYRDGGLYFLPPFSLGTAGVYHGKLEALYNAVDFLEHSREKYIILCDSTTICNIDFREAIASHIASGSDITVIANREKSDQYIDLVLNMKDGQIASLATNVIAEKEDLACMGMFIIDRELLLKVVKTSVSHGYFHLERDFIQRRFVEGTLSVNVWEFKGTVLRNTDVLSYYKNNLALLDENIRKGIFRGEAPIYTKVRDEEPSFYAAGASLKNCMVADGCRIEGTVENSVLFRDVKIGRGAYVKNAVIMQGTEIGAGARISQAIVDKDACIAPARILTGASASPVIIGKGTRI